MPVPAMTTTKAAGHGQTMDNVTDPISRTCEVFAGKAAAPADSVGWNREEDHITFIFPVPLS